MTCTLVSNGKESTIRWYDPKQAPLLIVNDAAAPGRIYGNPESLPWQVETRPSVGRDVGTFYDNVVAVLRDGKPKYVTPQSVREVIRVIGEARYSSQHHAAARRPSN